MQFCTDALALLLQGSDAAVDGSSFLYSVLGISVLSLIVAFLLARWVISQDTGTPEMQKISNAIKLGAEAFLRRQYRTILCLARFWL